MKKNNPYKYFTHEDIEKWAREKDTSPEIAVAIFELADGDEKAAYNIWKNQDRKDEVLRKAWEQAYDYEEALLWGKPEKEDFFGESTAKTFFRPLSKPCSHCYAYLDVRFDEVQGEFEEILAMGGGIHYINDISKDLAYEIKERLEQYFDNFGSEVERETTEGNQCQNKDHCRIKIDLD